MSLLRGPFTDGFLNSLPYRLIPNEQGPYLSRWTLRQRDDGGLVYIHFFHQSDATQETHSHPWDGRSVILAGGYLEQRVDVNGQLRERLFTPGDLNQISADTFHRVDLLSPDEGCWTLFETSSKRGTWHFRDTATGRLTRWRDALVARGLLVPT